MTGVRRGGLLGLLLLSAAPAGASAQARDTVSLADAIGEALGRNPSVRQARAAVRIADGQVREAWATVLPEVNALATYQRNLMVAKTFLPAYIFDPTAPLDSLIGLQFNAENNWFAGVTVTQPLFQVDALIGVGAAGKYRALERERARGTAQRVVTDVRRAYLAALAQLELARLNQSSVERIRATLEETRARHRAGLTSEYDVLRFEVQLANLEPQLRRARDGLAAAKRTLLVAMGRPAEGEIEMVGRLADVNVLDPARNTADNAMLIALSGPIVDERGLDTAAAAALAARSDVRQAQLAITVEQARLKVERAQLFPKVSLFGAYNVSAQDFGGADFFGENRSRAAWAGLQIEVPIFRGLRESARMQQARALIEQNRAQLDLARQQTMHDLRTLAAALDETRARVASQERAVAQARRGYQIATAEYREGLGSQLQVTDAELALRESEYNYALAVLDHLNARSDMDAALGTVPDAAGAAAARTTN
jgi:outer membrane protein TolC